MKEITDSKKTRQVQPVDFSFLSEADRGIVAAIETMLRTMYLWPDDRPIIISGLKYIKTQKLPNPATHKITSGKIIWRGVIYDVSEKQLRVGNGNIDNILNNIIIVLKKKVVSPSPVLDKDLTQSINCHYDRYGEIMQVVLPITMGDNTTSVITPTNTVATMPYENYNWIDMYRVQPLSVVISEMTANIENN